MDGTIVTTPEEKKTLVEQLLEEGREQGVALGREQGVALGRRQGMLDLAARLLGDEVAAELARIDDVEQLERRLATLLRA